MSWRFPFSAIVGQEEMKQALLATAVDASIGGVMVFGDRGTAKSTAVRALAGILPEIKVVDGCPYGCDPKGEAGRCEACAERIRQGARMPTNTMTVPVVDLPLGATEDRLVGSLDLERALSHGQKVFAPGLLAAAHRGFLYVDEINLLEDHLVDLLLDVAASGENVVEREGLSVRHPARFVLVGSGNPEEGELRPQLLDRFGLSVEVTTPTALADRLEIIRRRDAYDRDPAAFVASYAEADAAVRERITKARKRLPSLVVPEDLLAQLSELCIRLKTDGLRAELTLMKAVRAAAALEGARKPTLKHLKRMAPSVLRHRLRRAPLDETGSGVRIERALVEMFG